MYKEHKGIFGGHNVDNEGIYGGHNVSNATAHEVLHAGIWCPSLFAETKYYCKHCNVCQLVRKLCQRDELPLFPMIALEPFDKWESNFFGLITPPTLHTWEHYIITTTEYLTRWDEAVQVKYCTT